MPDNLSQFPMTADERTKLHDAIDTINLHQGLAYNQTQLDYLSGYLAAMRETYGTFVAAFQRSEPDPRRAFVQQQPFYPELAAAVGNALQCAAKAAAMTLERHDATREERQSATTIAQQVYFLTLGRRTPVNAQYFSGTTAHERSVLARAAQSPARTPMSVVVGLTEG